VINQQQPNHRRKTMRKTITKAIALLITFSVATLAQEKGTLTDTRDKKKYKTVKIGEQTWMAENLAYQAKGSLCYGEGDNECVKVTINTADDAIVCSKNKKLTAAEIQANCTKYGRLYDGEAAGTACPAGWKLPSEKDWNVLLNFAGGDEAGKNKLKAKSGWKNNEGKADNGTDAYGFAALAGGYFSNSFTEEYNDGHNYFVNAGISGSWQPYFIINSSRVGPSKSSIRCLKLSAEEEAAEKAAIEAAAAAEAFEKTIGKQFNPKINYGSMTDPRNKKTYKTVKIGEQIWMAENLNYYDGSSRCYEDKDIYCKRDGDLYNWTSAKKACPAGWHLPKDEEWATLENTVGGASTAGTKLKAASGWLDSTGKKPLNGTDDFGFSALPAGASGVQVSSNGAPSRTFSKNGSVGLWWTASDKGNDGIYRSISEAKSESASANKTNLYYSVRCVQGEAPKEAPAKAQAPANNPSKPMYCVIYMGGKISGCTELSDTQENKANCDMQNSGMKMMRGEAKWTDTKPNFNCNKQKK